MKPKLLLLFVVGLFIYRSQVSAQSFAVNNISLLKEAVTSDSSIQYHLAASIDLAGTIPVQRMHCKIKGVTSDSAYIDTDFIIPSTEGTFINGIMKDKQMLFVELGTFILREPVLLETELIDQNNNRSNTYQTNE